MKIQLLFTTALLVNVCSSIPIKDKGKSPQSLGFDDKQKMYTSNHDIINLVFPMNEINIKIDTRTEKDFYQQISLFFTEVDIKDTGEIDYKGLYVLKNHTAIKLLDNGYDSTAANDRTKNVFFAATDGIYKYNDEKKTADKYGTLNDNFIDVVLENGTNVVLYAINDKYEMYKITEDGTKKEKIVDNAKQLVIDYSSNIYFYDTNKVVYVMNKDGVKKIEGLKENPKHIELINPSAAQKNCALLFLDTDAYKIFANGSSSLGGLQQPDIKITGLSMEAALVQFIAFDKKIYTYNMLEILFDIVAEAIRKRLTG